jgi:hypothetical protein
MSSGRIYRVATIELTNVYIVAIIRILVKIVTTCVLSRDYIWLHPLRAQMGFVSKN